MQSLFSSRISQLLTFAPPLPPPPPRPWMFSRGCRECNWPLALLHVPKTRSAPSWNTALMEDAWGGSETEEKVVPSVPSREAEEAKAINSLWLGESVKCSEAQTARPWKQRWILLRLLFSLPLVSLFSFGFTSSSKLSRGSSFLMWRRRKETRKESLACKQMAKLRTRRLATFKNTMRCS